MPANLAVALISLWISSATYSSQSLAVAKPPTPYVDIGACPFEGCVYREWVTNSAVMIRKERSKTASLAFTVKKGERVTALTGVVITTKPGRVLFRESINLDSDSGVLHIEPEETLFLLTYQGEGSTKAWFQGKIYDHVLGETAFFDSRCEKDPSRCVGRIVERPVSEWWVQVRNGRGQIGWTKETDKFDGKDALGIEGGQTNCTTTALSTRNASKLLQNEDLAQYLLDRQNAKIALSLMNRRASMSDLAQWKVHGPVQTLKTEFAEWDLDKKDWKLPRPRYSAVFRVDGKISRRDHHNPDSSISHMDHLYDGEGRLVEIQFRTNDGPPVARTLYSYDDAGRHVRTVEVNSNGRRRESELCHYEGQKVKVKFLDRELTPAGFMYAAEGSEIYHPLNGAAKITTIYDQDDQPVEVHFHDASEQLLQRIIITRDGAGRLAAEELQLCGQVPLGSCCRGDGAQCSIEQKPEDLPPEVQAEMRAILSDQMGPDRVWSKTTYSYDDEGRVLERRTSLLGLGGDRSTFQYDEHGNQIEITEQNVPSEARSTCRLQYQYDSRGNWTECTVTRVEENGMLYPSNVERREITYWDSSSVIQTD